MEMIYDLHTSFLPLFHPISLLLFPHAVLFRGYTTNCSTFQNFMMNPGKSLEDYELFPYFPTFFNSSTCENSTSIARCKIRRKLMKDFVIFVQFLRSRVKLGCTLLSRVEEMLNKSFFYFLFSQVLRIIRLFVSFAKK